MIRKNYTLEVVHLFEHRLKSIVHSSGTPFVWSVLLYTVHDRIRRKTHDAEQGASCSGLPIRHNPKDDPTVTGSGNSSHCMEPWKNGTSESCIKSVKRSLKAAIGEGILTFTELQTVPFKVANLINERPVGRHPRSPKDGSYLCPNYPLLGCSTTRVTSGLYKESTNPRLCLE